MSIVIVSCTYPWVNGTRYHHALTGYPLPAACGLHTFYSTARHHDSGEDHAVAQ
jgi:hypothetical protein